MKNNFFTGLIILIPIVLTFAIIQFLINLLTIPFLGIIENIFDHSEGYQIAIPFIKLIILILLVVIIFCIGFFAQLVVVRSLFDYIDGLIKHTPGINGIYQAIKETVNAFVKPTNSCFSSVVLIKFPHQEAYCLGFVMKENQPNEQIPFPSAIAVFVPATPNPTVGYLQLRLKEELIYLDMKVDDALKLILSIGIIIRPFTSPIAEPPATKEETP